MSLQSSAPIHIVGGGLAGCEAAWQIVGCGVPVVLHEMRPLRATAAHKTAALAELVCSNSFRSDDPEHNAVGLLHEEMRRLDSLVMRTADANQVPAGGALAVDRDGFAAAITAALEAHPLVTLAPRGDRGSAARRLGQRDRGDRPPHLHGAGGRDRQAGGRAGARLLRRHRPDRSSQLHRHVGRLAAVALRQGRPGRIGRRLHQLPALARPLRGLHRCAAGGPEGRLSRLGDRDALFRRLPADRGHGRARPRNPAARSDEAVRADQSQGPGRQKPYAVVQLRQDNRLGTLFNMVGFQTKLTHGEQVRIFRTIPGLESAEFARLGGLHRNTFLNAPKLLDATLRLKADAAPALRGPDHRLRGLCGIGRDRAHGGPLRGGRAARRNRWRRRRRRPPTARCSATSPAAISRPSMRGRAPTSR